ncbi:MAG: hypothetical protein QN210_03110 [Armatimonadota bacterium]|nr:hypothetical protein [Armatimonadota bacterium]MDR7587780.1 hypothetical protein [Armatimonadota bacterium]MDR7611390.1 hypothetical protein [Armatimonadota bacterium]
MRRVPVLGLALIPVLAAGALQSGVLFESAGEVREPGGRIFQAALLPGGRVVYYRERTRPPTDEERARRAEWFDAEWEKFRRRAESEGLPEIERRSEEIARKLEEELAGRPPLVRSMQPFFSSAARGIPVLLRLALTLALPLARQHFINQPVVVEAGLRVWSPDRAEVEVASVDVARLYGEESWMRAPIDALNLRVSPDGRFVALETTEEAFALFELTGGALVHFAQVRGQSPLGWSRDGRRLYATRRAGGGAAVVVYEAASLQDMARCRADFDRLLLGGATSRAIIRGVAAGDDRLAIALFSDLGVCRLADGSLSLPDPPALRRIGPPRGVAFSRDGAALYVASARGFAVLDPRTFAVRDQYVRPAGAEVDFQSLADVSPDGRYAAVLYGRERPEGWATLVIWEIAERRVVQRIGTEPGRMLNTISAGFRFTYPPALLTDDWRYLLTVRQDGSLELFRRVR